MLISIVCYFFLIASELLLNIVHYEFYESLSRIFQLTAAGQTGRVGSVVQSHVGPVRPQGSDSVPTLFQQTADQSAQALALNKRPAIWQSARVRHYTV